MQISKLLAQNPYVSSIYGERHLNDSKGSFSDYSEVNPMYDPQGNLSHVVLPYTLLSEMECSIFSSSPSQELAAWVKENGKYRFFWHPDVERRGLVVRGSVLAQPTSSTRTLLTEDGFRVYIKTDLDKKHFRFIRRLQQSSVEHSVAISKDLREFCESKENPARYSFFPESFGLAIRGGDYEGSGVLFRETKPFPFQQAAHLIMPYHSLYAHDPYATQDEPLLVQLVKMHGSARPSTYFVEEVAGPLLESWVGLVSKRGLLPELHGQNALLEFDESFRPLRLVHRDFQGTYSDSETRQRLGLATFTKHVAGVELGTTVESQYSHVFDGMIGRYLLSRLTNSFCLYFPYEYSFLANAIKEYHHGLKGWDIAKFPDTTYRFANSAQEQVGNEVSFTDSEIPPEFR